MDTKAVKKSPEYLEGFYDGTQSMQEIYDKCASDADGLNYDKGRRDACAEVRVELDKILAENRNRNSEVESARADVCLRLKEFISNIL
jgi:hypothetical protein